MADKKALLSINGTEDKVLELPIYSGSLGPDVVDVRGLASNSLFTLSLIHI